MAYEGALSAVVPLAIALFQQMEQVTAAVGLSTILVVGLLYCGLGVMTALCNQLILRSLTCCLRHCWGAILLILLQSLVVIYLGPNTLSMFIEEAEENTRNVWEDLQKIEFADSPPEWRLPKVF